MVWRFRFIDFHVTIILIGRMMRELNIHLIKFGTLVDSVCQSVKNQTFTLSNWKFRAWFSYPKNQKWTHFEHLPGCFMFLKTFGRFQNPFDRTPTLMCSRRRCCICFHSLRRKNTSITANNYIDQYWPWRNNFKSTLLPALRQSICNRLETEQKFTENAHTGSIQFRLHCTQNTICVDRKKQ